MTSNASSANEVKLIRFAEKIVTPLIREGVFEDFERALRALLLDYVDRQIAKYDSKNSEFETRHKQDFNSFTASLKNRAAPDQEEEWMDWEAAAVMLRKWRKIREQVIENGSA